MYLYITPTPETGGKVAARVMMAVCAALNMLVRCVPCVCPVAAPDPPCLQTFLGLDIGALAYSALERSGFVSIEHHNKCDEIAPDDIAVATAQRQRDVIPMRE